MTQTAASSVPHRRLPSLPSPSRGPALPGPPSSTWGAQGRGAGRLPPRPPPQAWAACIFNEVILAGGCRLQSLCRDWHLLALFSGGIWPPRRPLTTSSLDSGFSTNSPVLLRVGGGPVQPQKVPFRTFTALFPGQARATFQDRDCVRGLTHKDEPRVLRAPVYILFQ